MIDDEIRREFIERTRDMPVHYVLDGRKVVPIDLMTYIENGAKRGSLSERVAYTKVGDAEVSTIFLGFDIGLFHDRPTLFETMIFGGDLDGVACRYSTYDEAEAGHAAVVERIKEAQA